MQCAVHSVGLSQGCEVSAVLQLGYTVCVDGQLQVFNALGSPLPAIVVEVEMD